MFVRTDAQEILPEGAIGDVAYPTQSMDEDLPLDPGVRADGGNDRVVKFRKRQFLLLFGLIVAIVGMFGIGFLVGSKKKTSTVPSIVMTTSPSTSQSPSLSPSQSPTFLPPPPSNVTVGVYYYPWYGEEIFHGGQYLRKDLGQHPLLGEYNDRDPAVISQHLTWSRKANIRAWITSWWGPDSIEDNTTRTVILPHKELGDIKVAIHYESLGRSKNATGQFNGTLILQSAGPDVTYICEHYFKHPNYLRIDDRPVLVFYLSRRFESLGLMRDTANIMRSAAAQCGENLFIVGDHAFGASFSPFDYLDAITNYDIYGSTTKTNGYANQTAVDNYFEQQQEWRIRAQQQGIHYIPAVSPGFNDRSVRPGHLPLSRRLSFDLPYGSLFEESLRQALDMLDAGTQNLLLVTSFNEWHEDTQIEPVIGFSTNRPFNLTLGLEYEGYAYLYLDILRRMTIDKEQV